MEGRLVEPRGISVEEHVAAAKYLEIRRRGRHNIATANLPGMVLNMLRAVCLRRKLTSLLGFDFETSVEANEELPLIAKGMRRALEAPVSEDEIL